MEKTTIQKNNSFWTVLWIQIHRTWIRIQDFGPIQGYIINFEIFTHLSLWIMNLYLKSYIFCLHFIPYLHVWVQIRIFRIRIRIQKALDYGSNTDPDPQHCFDGGTETVKSVGLKQNNSYQLKSRISHENVPLKVKMFL